MPISDQPRFVDKAVAAWGRDCPAWVIELASIADARRLNGAGDAIGYSGSTVSSVISNKYPGDVAMIAAKVAGALMGETVACPVLGDTNRATCLDWQAKPWAPTSSLRMRMYRACHGGCVHFRDKGGRDGR